MRDGSGRYGLGLAALAAVAIPVSVIAILDPRIGLLRPRPVPEATQLPARLPDQPATAQALAKDPVRDPASPPAAGTPCPVCPPADRPAPIRGTLQGPDIQVPDVAAERAAQRERLIGWTAHPDRVAGSAATLDLIGLVFTVPRDTGAGYRPLALDLAGAPDRAVVLLAEQPVTVALATRPPDRAAALGVEASAAFAVAEGRPDLLAGFRALPFGASEVAPVLDPLRFGPETLRGFCDALQRWATQFGLPLWRTRYTLLENPTRIALSGEALHSDGTARGRVSGRRLARLCRA